MSNNHKRYIMIRECNTGGNNIDLAFDKFVFDNVRLTKMTKNDDDIEFGKLKYYVDNIFDVTNGDFVDLYIQTPEMIMLSPVQCCKGSFYLRFGFVCPKESEWFINFVNKIELVCISELYTKSNIDDDNMTTGYYNYNYKGFLCLGEHDDNELNNTYSFINIQMSEKEMSRLQIFDNDNQFVNDYNVLDEEVKCDVILYMHGIKKCNGIYKLDIQLSQLRIKPIDINLRQCLLVDDDIKEETITPSLYLSED